MPKYVPRLEGIMHDPSSGRALCLLTLGHISAYNMDNKNIIVIITLNVFGDLKKK
jgi:hypothetical protein